MCVEFQIAGSMEGIEELRRRLEHLAKSWRLSKQTLFEINLVLEELCSNFVEHSEGLSRSDVNIKLSRNSSEYVIAISDSGPPFDPTLVAPPDLGLSLAEKQYGGLGLHFVKHFTDQMLYSREKGRNIVTIMKKREGD